MTGEQQKGDWADAYVQLTAPGVPYSAIRVPFSKDGVRDGILMCRFLAAEWRKAFAAGTTPDEQELLHDDEPAGVQVVINPETHEAEMPQDGERVTGERFACPQCGKQAKQSVDRYQEWEPGRDGRMYPQKWFCPNEQCQTKSLWRSKLKPLAA